MSDWNLKVFWYSSESKVIFRQLVLAYSPSCNSTNPPEMNHFKLFSSVKATTAFDVVIKHLVKDISSTYIFLKHALELT